MRKLVLYCHLSLDGVIQGPGGRDEDTSGGFTEGGWSMAIGDNDLHDAVMELFSEDFDLMLGRRTYDIWAAYWPNESPDHPIGAKINRANKYVATHHADTLSWAPAVSLSDDIPKAVRDIKSGDGPDIHVWGSSELLQILMTENLIDEYHLWIYPVVVGSGKKLFQDVLPARLLKLERSKVTPAGMVLQVYTPAGNIPRHEGEVT